MNTFRKLTQDIAGRTLDVEVMEYTLTIRLVRVDGYLVGLTASDRVNLRAYGYDFGIRDDRNHSGVKRLRRMIGGTGDDTRVVVQRGDSPVIYPVQHPMRPEMDNLGPAWYMYTPGYDLSLPDPAKAPGSPHKAAVA